MHSVGQQLALLKRCALDCLELVKIDPGAERVADQNPNSVVGLRLSHCLRPGVEHGKRECVPPVGAVERDRGNVTANLVTKLIQRSPPTTP
jgi:hypothetical protein